MRNDTSTSTITAAVVIIPKYLISRLCAPSATTVANAATPKKRANSTYQRNFPGLNTKSRFIIQQKTFAITNPPAVATAARTALAPSEISTNGRPAKRGTGGGQKGEGRARDG